MPFNPRDELARDVALPVEGSEFGGMVLAHNTRNRAEVDTALAEAQASGATLLKPAEDAFLGVYSGRFADPDGCLREVAWNPNFEMKADGSIRLPD
ncbi:MAG: hypothetical protein QF450_00220 [Rhodospirillales bacterium]|jgi:hypothetical protein|nr:hypothetical protein [Rhodospirillales bacterium]HJO72850.1 hypothetical protein [Rhodospirillales bacterium]